MSEEKQVPEEKEKKPHLLKSWWSMQWLTSNMNYFMFLCLLAVLYIANGHMADKTIRDINKTQKELKELQFEYKTVKSEVMFKSEVFNCLLQCFYTTLYA